MCQFLQYDAASSGGATDTRLRESRSVGPNPTEPEPEWEGRAGFPRRETLHTPAAPHGAGVVPGDTSRLAAFPREFINPLRHLGWRGDFPVQGLVLLILHCFLP